MKDLFNHETEPTQTVRVEFDGGTPCNIPSKGYGIGYGSYKFNAEKPIPVDHGIPCSNNAAEVLTIAVALEELAKRIDPRTVCVEVFGDSQIALKWVLFGFEGTLRTKRKKGPSGSSDFKEAIKRLCESAQKFGKVTTHWQPREKSVKTFGH